MTIGDKAHWERRYGSGAPESLSWFEAEPTASLALLDRAALSISSHVIDVGGGASRLVDHLLDRGLRHVTVLDIAGAALAAARSRLGPLADAVTWCEADVLTASFTPDSYDLWHDRAVFHFLTAPEARARYVAQLSLALRPGGSLVIGTFAEDGPSRCSGLDVERYTPEKLEDTLGSEFELCDVVRHAHPTPMGSVQSFLYTRWKRSGG
jgi:SAM-dependent methyltransferase